MVWGARSFLHVGGSIFALSCPAAELHEKTDHDGDSSSRAHQLCCSGKCESISVSVPQFPNVGLGKCMISGQLSLSSLGYDPFHYQPLCMLLNGPCDLADLGACCSQTCINRGHSEMNCKQQRPNSGSPPLYAQLQSELDSHCSL